MDKKEKSLLRLIGRYSKVLASYFLGYALYLSDSVSIVITNRCNLKCLMYEFWKENKQDSEILDLAELEVLFKDIHALGTRNVILTDGEPFLRRDLIDILKMARSIGLETLTVTNSTLINTDNVLDFVKHTNLVYVSLDAPTKLQHERIGGYWHI